MVDSAAMERLKQLAVVVAVLTVGVVLVGLFHSLQLLIANPIALLGSIFLAALMMYIFVKVALVPERRFTGWARGITGPNGRWLFLILLLGWGAGMAFLASLGLGPQQAGAPAFVGLFVGIFLFMGFIWAVVGE
ncbi:hypothetical protein BH24CHL6_BH24CHL6_03370 [soil metagenome]